MGAFLEEAGFIKHPHGIWLGEIVRDIGAEAVAECVGVPVGATEQVLKAIGRGVARDFSQLPAILAFHRAEQSSEIGDGTSASLGAGKERANASLNVTPIDIPDLHIKQIDLQCIRWVCLVHSDSSMSSRLHGGTEYHSYNCSTRLLCKTLWDGQNAHFAAFFERL